MDPTVNCGIPMMALTSSPSRNNSSGSIVNWKCSGMVLRLLYPLGGSPHLQGRFVCKGTRNGNNDRIT